MKKLYFLLCCFIFAAGFSSAQSTVTQQWAQLYNGPDSLDDGGFAIGLDGSVYSGGISFTQSSVNPVIVKYSKNGIFNWAAIYTQSFGASLIRSLSVDAQSNVYTAGYVTDSVNNRHFTILKYDSAGVFQWEYRDSSGSEAFSLVLDGSGNIFATGYIFNSVASLIRDFVTVKLSSTGQVLWRNVFNSGQDDFGHDVAVDLLGNAYVAGEKIDTSTFAHSYITAKYNSSGTLLWNVSYPSGLFINSEFIGGLALKASHIGILSNTKICISGAKDSGTGADYAVVSYDSSGAFLWESFYDGTQNADDFIKDLAVSSNGGIYVTGSSAGSGTGNDYATVKFNYSGTQLWSARYNGTGNGTDEANALSLDTVGNIYVCGQSFGASDDYATVKYDTAGVQQWVMRFDGVANSTDVANDVAATGNDEVYVTGYSFNGTDFDFATVKYSQNTSVPLSVAVTTNDATCNGAGNGTAGAIASGGTSPYTYQWSTGATTQNITGLAAGIYFLIVTDNAAATASASATINEPPIDTLVNPASCSDLLISEYVEGTDHNTALEFYNPSENPIVLNNYFARVFMNGAQTPLIVQLVGVVLPKKTHVIANPNASAGILAVANQTSNKINFNGDDAIQFVKVLNTININIDSIEGLGQNPHAIFDTLQLDTLDQIGITNVYPGNSGWTVGSATTKDITLRRNFGVTSGTEDWNCGQYQWKTSAQNDISGLGQHQNKCSQVPVDIFYGFQNPIATVDSIDSTKKYLEFDIYVKASNNNTYFDGCNLYVLYDTLSFGSKIAFNQKIHLTRGVQFDIPTYYDPITSALAGDNNDYTVSINASVNQLTNPLARVNITTTPIVLYHVKIEVKQCNQNSGISFTDPYPGVESFYTDTANEPPGNTQIYTTQTFENTVDVSLPCNSNNILWISDFNPKTITAGTNSILTITGTGFGSQRDSGQVAFKNADNGGTTYITILDSIDYNFWGDSLIRVIVPSKVDTIDPLYPLNNELKSPIGSGKFYVKNNSGDSAITSTDTLTIRYARANTLLPFDTANVIPPQAKLKNYLAVTQIADSSTIVFHLDTSIANYPLKTAIVKKAIKDWRCATSVNFTVDDVGIINQNYASDNLSVIHIDPNLHGDPVAQTQTYVIGCSGNMIIKEADIKLSQDFINLTTFFPIPQWTYDTTSASVPNDSLDFYGTVLHELGHAHGLFHTIIFEDIMFWARNPGPIPIIGRVSIDPTAQYGSLDARTGAIEVNTESENISFSPCSGIDAIFISSNNSQCGSPNTKIKSLLKNNFNLKIFPIPATDILNISYNLSSSSHNQIKIIDFLGKEVLSISNAYQIDGNYQYQVNLSNLASGLYFLIININGTIQTNKIIKL